MAFGSTFEEIASKKTHPEKIQTKYGYFVNAVNEHEFSLKQYFFKQGYNGRPNIPQGILFVESGKIIIKTDDSKEDLVIEKGYSITLPKGFIFELTVESDSIVYVFSSQNYNPDFSTPKPTFNNLEKYWGEIKNIASNEHLAAKLILKNANSQSSLEYHVSKKEAYIVQSGKIKVGLRVGRAENKSITLEQGDVFVIPQGAMHMRIGIEDSVIIEISTKDDDKDSKLVEDGKTYVHREV